MHNDRNVISEIETVHSKTWGDCTRAVERYALADYFITRDAKGHIAECVREQRIVERST